MSGSEAAATVTVKTIVDMLETYDESKKGDLMNALKTLTDKNNLVEELNKEEHKEHKKKLMVALGMQVEKGEEKELTLDMLNAKLTPAPAPAPVEDESTDHDDGDGNKTGGRKRKRRRKRKTKKRGKSRKSRKSRKPRRKTKKRRKSRKSRRRRR